MKVNDKELEKGECIVLSAKGDLIVQKYIATLVGAEQCVVQSEDKSCYIANSSSVILYDCQIELRIKSLKNNIKEAEEYIQTQKMLINKIREGIK